MCASQVSSSIPVFQGVAETSQIPRKLPIELANEIRIMGQLWGLKKGVYADFNSDGDVVYKSIRIIARTEFEKVFQQYIRKNKVSPELGENLIKEMKNNVYLDKKDMWEVRNKLKLVIPLINDFEEIKDSLEREFNRVFSSNGCRYIHIDQMLDFVDHIISTVTIAGGALVSDLVKQIFFPWRLPNANDLTSRITYCSMNFFDRLNIPFGVCEEFNKMFEGTPDQVEIDVNEKYLREATISKVLSLVGLSRHAVCGIIHRMPIDQEGLTKRSVLLRAAEKFSVSRGIDEDFQSINRDVRVQVIAIGIIHALLHVQNGNINSVRLVDTAQGQKEYKCAFLNKSLIPVSILPGKRESLIRIITDSMITLQSFLWYTRFFEKVIPHELITMMKSDEFKMLTTKGFLISCFAKEDPIFSQPELLEKMEQRFIERAKKMQLFAETSRKPTLKRLFEKLYPNEYAFLLASLKLKLRIQPNLYAETIIKASQAASNTYDVNNLKFRLDNMLRNHSLPSSEYTKLV